MKAKLTLNNLLLSSGTRRAILSKAVQESAAELVQKIKQNILDSVPQGRIYKRGSITKRATRSRLNLGLRRVRGTTTRIIAGTRFHRASRRGQPPAVDSGKLLRSIRVRQTAPLQITVFTPLPYAKKLDDREKLNRPFITKERDNFRRKFKQNIEKAIAENS